MKNTSIIILILVLTATLFTGCRNTANTEPNTTVPSSSTKPTVVPMPEIPTPSGSDTTAPTAIAPEGSSGMGDRAMRPGRRGPRS